MPLLVVNSVHVRDQSGALRSFSRGDSVPDWAAKLLGAHCTAAAPAQSVAQPTAPAKRVCNASADGIPPRGGPGGSRDVWAAYAQAHGVTVPDDWKRSQIIDACSAVGVRVE